MVKVEDAEFKLHKAIHFALNVNDLDSFIKYLEKTGIEYQDWIGKKAGISLRGDGIRQIYIEDPDGHWIEINDASN